VRSVSGAEATEAIRRVRALAGVAP
jgi:hypothetical protein